MLGNNLHLDRVAQVGLVRTIPKRSVLIRNLLPRLIDLATTTKLFKNPTNNGLDRIKNILLFYKAHLKVELVEIRGRAICARVFVAETRCNLEIFVKTRDHDQLFELLRGLWQCIEFTGVLARWHKEIARSFRRGCRDNRRLIFAEVLIPHAFAHGRHHVRTQSHVALQLFAAQIEVAILQARFLWIFLIPKHHQR